MRFDIVLLNENDNDELQFQLSANNRFYSSGIVRKPLTTGCVKIKRPNTKTAIS